MRLTWGAFRSIMCYTLKIKYHLKAVTKTVSRKILHREPTFGGSRQYLAETYHFRAGSPKAAKVSRYFPLLLRQCIRFT